MNKDLELALKIKATHDGLGDIKDTIAELQRAGVETAEWEKTAAELDEQLTTVGNNQQLIDNFVLLQKQSKVAAENLEQAQQKAQALGKELSATEKPTKAQASAFKKAREAVNKAGKSYQETRQKIQGMRSELKTAGINTKDLASAQVKLNKTSAQLNTATTTLDARLKTHSQSVSELRSRLEQSRTASLGYEKALAKSVRQANAATAANTKQASSHRKISTGVQSISTQLDGLKESAKRLFLATQATQLVNDLGQLADEYTNLSARVELAVGEGNAFNQGMEDIRSTANATGSSLSAIGSLYTGLNRSTKELGIAQKDVAQLTDTISKSFLISGSSAQEADAAITQLNQGLQSGVLRGDEFNSVMEQSPRLAQAMADSLGVTRGELRQMAEDGKLTTEVVVNALQQQSAAIQQEYEKMPDTIGRASQRMKNEFLIAIGEMDKAAGTSEFIAESFSSIAENMDDVINTLELVGEVATAALIRKYVPAVIAATKSMSQAAAAGTLFNSSLTATGRSAGIAATGLSLVKNALPLIAITLVVDETLSLIGAFNQLSDATERLDDVNRQLDDSNAELAKRYQEISEKTGVVVTNMTDLEAAIASGKIVVDALTGSYISAAQALELKAQREKEAADVSTSMSYTQAELSKRYEEVNKQLQVAIDDNSKLSSVMSGALLDALKNGETGVGAFAIALRSIEQNGKLTQEQIAEGLSPALTGLSDEERSRFGDVIKAAMEKIRSGADTAGLSIEQLQALLDSITASQLEASLQRLGISVEELNNSITSGTNTAISDLDILSQHLTETGISAENAGPVIESALVKSFQNAKTEADKAALADKINEFRDAGLLAETQYQQLTQTLQDSGNKGSEAAKNVKSAWEDAGKSAESAGARTEASSTKAAEATEKVGEAAESSSRNAQALGDAMAGWFQGVRDTMRSLSAESAIMFDKKLGINSAPIVDEITSLENSIESARQIIQSAAKDNLRLFDASGALEWQNSVTTAAQEVQIAYSQQKIDAIELQNALADGGRLNESFLRSAENSIRSMDQLGQQDLRTLRQALESANQQLEQLQQKSQDTVDNLKDELDGLQGNQDAIDERDYKRKKEEYEKLLEEARQAGDAVAIKNYTDALQLLEKVRKEQKGQRDELSRSSSGSRGGFVSEQNKPKTEPVRTVKVELGNRSFEVPEGQENTFIDALEDFVERTS